MDIKVERLCKQCHSNFELKAIEHNGCLRASIANFEECPDCGTRNDHWIKVNWPAKKTPSRDWFEELYSGSQKEIISLTEEHNLAHPREYGSAADILLDIRRVS